MFALFDQLSKMTGRNYFNRDYDIGEVRSVRLGASAAELGYDGLFRCEIKSV